MLSTEPNYHVKNKQIQNTDDTLFNEEFIGYINSLSNAILEYCKVSKNISKNKDMLIKFAKTELNNEKLLLENSINENSSIFGLIQLLNEVFNKIEFNNQSDQNNLVCFFNDAKILFKKLKEKRKDLIIQSKSRSYSTTIKKIKQQISSSVNNAKILDRKYYENNSKSEVNRNIRDLKFSVLYSKKNNKSFNMKSKAREEFIKKNINNKEKNQMRNSMNNEYFKTTDNNAFTVSDIENISSSPKKNLTETEELQQLRLINKKLSSELSRYKSKMLMEKKDINNQNNNSNNFNNFEKINIYIKDKDKVISTLKNEMNQSTKKFKDILTKYKTQINKLQDENKSLRMNTASSIKTNNSLSEYEKSLNSKLSTLIKENQHLKQSIQKMKMGNVVTDYNINLSPNVFSPSKSIDHNLLQEIDKLKNKITVLENNYSKKQTENKELNNKVNLLQKKLEEEKTIFSDKNLELSQNLINKQNELLNLQKENYNKNNEIVNLKGMLNQGINYNSQNKKDEYEKIISKYKKIQHDQMQQISTLKNELNEKDELIQEQNYNLEEFKNQFSSKEAEKKNLLNIIENLNKKKDNLNNLNEKLEEQKNLNSDLNDELNKIKNDNALLKNKVLSSEKRISFLKANSDMNTKNNNTIEQLKNEIQSLKFENEKLNYQYNQLRENLVSGNHSKTNHQKEELEGLKLLVNKLQNEREKIDNEFNIIKRENEKMKNQIIRLSETLPEEYNELQKQYHELEIKYKILKKNNSNNPTPKKIKTDEKPDDKLVKENADLKKEIDQLKKKNNELIAQLEDKEIKKNFYDNRSEDANKSNYEEEFDLRKMAKGARDKNRSQDINIDYPGIQTYKEKIRELEFYYNSLESLVKKLLLTLQCTPKNKTYVTELCRIVGFDLEMTNKIITNKNKNFILGLFSK